MSTADEATKNEAAEGGEKEGTRLTIYIPTFCMEIEREKEDDEEKKMDERIRWDDLLLMLMLTERDE